MNNTLKNYYYRVKCVISYADKMKYVLPKTLILIGCGGLLNTVFIKEASKIDNLVVIPTKDTSTSLSVTRILLIASHGDRAVGVFMARLRLFVIKCDQKSMA